MKIFLWNMLANMKNSQVVKKAFVIQPNKKLCATLLDILWDEGFILGYRLLDKRLYKFKIFLKYKDGRPVIKSITTITKPGLRRYYSLNQLWKIKLNNELLIISTNKGLLSLANCKKLQLGGEPFLLIR